MIAAVEAGESCRAVVARFDVAVSSVVKWSQRYRATGSVAPASGSGVSPATVSRVLRRLGLNKLNALEPAEPTRRGTVRNSVLEAIVMERSGSSHGY